MTKHILACGLLLLCLTACKGRHADGTPTGETVEVNVEAIEAVEIQPIEVQETAPVASDSLSAPATVADSAAAPAVPTLTGRPQ